MSKFAQIIPGQYNSPVLAFWDVNEETDLDTLPPPAALRQITDDQFIDGIVSPHDWAIDGFGLYRVGSPRPKFARFDHTVPEPSPVIGWYDMAFAPYDNFPSAEDILPLSEAQWATRMDNPSGWAVRDGGLVPYTPPRPVLSPGALARQAMSLGIEVAFADAPDLNGYYAIDVETRTDMQSEVLSLLLDKKFVNGGTTIDWPMITGHRATFTATQFKNLHRAVSVYTSALKAVMDADSGDLPTTPVAI